MLDSYTLKCGQFQIKELCTYKVHSNLIIQANKKFLLFKLNGDEKIYIYECKTKSYISVPIKSKEIQYFNFHNFYEEIFFVCSGPSVLIYEIEIGTDINKTVIKELSEIKGHFSPIILASFHPLNSNILLTISKDNNINIYDIRKSLAINHIILEENYLDIKWGNNNIGFLNSNKYEISYFNYKDSYINEIDKYTLDICIYDFHFFNDNEIIIIAEGRISLVNEKEILQNLFLKKKVYIYNNFYNNKKKILILFFVDEIILIKIENEKIEELFNFNSSIKVPYFIKENSLDKDELCYIYEIIYPLVFVYSIVENNEQKGTIMKTNITNYNIREYAKNFVKNISNIPLLISKNNNTDNKNDFHNYKKYFKYEEIKEELIIIKTRNLFLRKKIVCDNINSIDNIKDYKEKYIFLLKLLANDNTNTNLIINYLKFLENENLQNNIKNFYNNDYETFNDEFSFYSKILPVKEGKEELKKDIDSQKEELLKLFKEVLKYKDKKNKFENYLETFKNYFENKIYFNMPLNFSNENFFFFRNINIIKYHFKNLYDIIQKKKKENIKKYQKTEIFDQENKKFVADIFDFIEYKLNKFLNEFLPLYSNNNEKINYLIILITQAENIDEFDYGFNMVCCENISEKDIQNFNKENSDKIEIITDNVIKFKDKYYGNYKYICLNNINRFEEFYNYEYYKLNYPKDVELSKIKEFYIHILPLRCFKTIYLALYGEDSFYPFDDIEFTKYFVNNYFEFLPMPLSNTGGLTDKFSMKTYFISFLKEVDKSYKKQYKKILRTASLINVGNHEIGHNFVNNNFYMENCQASIETPRKNNIEFSEGGYYIELALYGRILKYITLAQALYLINEENYKKEFLEFQKGFNNISNSDLKIKGAFSELFKDLNFDKDFLNISRNIFIKQKPFSSSQDEKTIIPRFKNDIIGKIVSNENYLDLLNKYT